MLRSLLDDLLFFVSNSLVPFERFAPVNVSSPWSQRLCGFWQVASPRSLFLLSSFSVFLALPVLSAALRCFVSLALSCPLPAFFSASLPSSFSSSLPVSLSLRHSVCLPLCFSVSLYLFLFVFFLSPLLSRVSLGFPSSHVLTLSPSLFLWLFPFSLLQCLCFSVSPSLCLPVLCLFICCSFGLGPPNPGPKKQTKNLAWPVA